MLLNRNHRLALLSELNKAKEELEINNRCLIENKEETISSHFEIACFLSQQKIKLIEESLTDNEIDF